MSYVVDWLDKDGGAYDTAPLEAETLAQAIVEVNAKHSGMIASTPVAALNQGLYGYGFHIREVA